MLSVHLFGVLNDVARRQCAAQIRSNLSAERFRERRGQNVLLRSYECQKCRACLCCIYRLTVENWQIIFRFCVHGVYFFHVVLAPCPGALVLPRLPCCAIEQYWRSSL